MMKRITQIEVLEASRLRLHYVDGAVATVDFAPLAGEGGPWQVLSDPAFFAQVRLGQDGRYIEWPGELDFCADALWQQAQTRQHAA